MKCIFCRIIKKELPARIIYEDEKHLSFLDAFPQNPGHTLVIPKQHHPDMFLLTPDAYIQLWLTVKKVERIVRKAAQCQRTYIKVLGEEVPHVHVHLIPETFAGLSDARDLVAVYEIIRSAHL